MKVLKTISVVAGLAVAGVSVAQAGAPGYATANVNLRTGPDTAYPSAGVIPSGAPLTIEGCLQDESWCDVNWGGLRGWVYSTYLATVRQGQTAVVPDWGLAAIGIPIVAFAAADYWNRYYVGRPWYGERARWYAYTPRPRPGWYPPPPGPRPAGWWKPGYKPPPPHAGGGRPGGPGHAPGPAIGPRPGRPGGPGGPGGPGPAGRPPAAGQPHPGGPKPGGPMQPPGPRPGGGQVKPPPHAGGPGKPPSTVAPRPAGPGTKPGPHAPAGRPGQMQKGAGKPHPGKPHPGKPQPGQHQPGQRGLHR
ncbi:SH3 domain-containing protein [Xanthobacter sp. TB0139]|uniref:SH3 domain-containing protein n=1 Tax=Xanthobacter sp. TB0139 TaxID=3459178 RepID=UPI004039D342